MGQMGEDIADWKYFLSIISKCTDDYLYIYDLSDDYAIYSSSITKDFELDVAEFSNAGRKLKDVIYPDDYEAVFNNSVICLLPTVVSIIWNTAGNQERTDMYL